MNSGKEREEIRRLDWAERKERIGEENKLLFPHPVFFPFFSEVLPLVGHNMTS